MQTPRFPINPELISWARERAGFSVDDLAGKFNKLPEWERGDIQPTLRQLESFARKVHIPLGYLFCSFPPKEILPISDFRTIESESIKRPSPELLEMVYACELRQDWYREYALAEQLPEHEFIGSISIKTPTTYAAKLISDTIDFGIETRQTSPNWIEALRSFRRKVDDAGILVMASGIVRNNTHRRLDVQDFRGFALSDSHAPLIFINSNDTNAAQIFTLAHELAHLWLGNSALTDSGIVIDSDYPQEEVWCNAVAAELLVPLDHLQGELQRNEPLPDALSRLAKLYKVSSLVILRRLIDLKQLEKDEFELAWKHETNRLQKLNRTSKGGDFYRATISRVGRRFAHAIVSSANAGKTFSRDAFSLLGITSAETFNKLSHEIKASN